MQACSAVSGSLREPHGTYPDLRMKGSEQKAHGRFQEAVCDTLWSLDSTLEVTRSHGGMDAREREWCG